MTTIDRFSQRWINLHGNHHADDIQFTRPRLPASGERPLQEVGRAVRSVVQEAFDREEPLRVDGSRWALSDVGVPDKRATQLAEFSGMWTIPTEDLSDTYARACAARNVTPIYILAATRVRQINKKLAEIGLALQTSGASDGQTLAGATSCGTHGASMPVGALHDPVVAVHLLTGPDSGVIAQSNEAPLRASFATRFGDATGCPASLLNDTNALRAAQVHLGALGVVVGMVVEAVPLYALHRVSTAVYDDATWREVLRTADPTSASKPGYEHYASPDHLEVVLNPFRPNPATSPQGWVLSMKKFPNDPRDATIERAPGIGIPPHPDLVSVVAELQGMMSGPVLESIFRKLVTDQLVQRYGAGDSPVRKALPGVMFGPTALPEGKGDSLEFVVRGADAEPAVVELRRAIRDALDAGAHFGGAMGIRFTGASNALLAMNTHAPSCFVELPCVRTNETAAVYDRCAKALTQAGLPWACHWGQTHRISPALARSWWGDRYDRWIDARHSLLNARGQAVFANPLIRALGLA